MGMPDVARRYTVDEVLAFPADGNRYELVDGELLVTPAPQQRHQGVVMELAARLHAYLTDKRSLARVFPGPGDVFWSGRDYVQPDILVVPADQVTGNWRDIQTLLLAVEVVSPDSARYDRVTKRDLYRRMGVATYWVVDADARVVEVWHPDDTRPEIVTDLLRWLVADETAEVEIGLAEVFGE